MSDEQEILDGIEAATLAALDHSSLALIEVLAVFTSQGADRLHTEDLLLALDSDASLPMPAAAARLAELLGEHGVRPRSVTVEGRRARGYRREDVEAAMQSLDTNNDTQGV